MTLTRRLFAARMAGAAALGTGFSSQAWADAPVFVRNVAVEAAGAAVRLVVSLDRPVPARTFFLESPSRFVVDLPMTQFALRGASAGEGPGAGVVSRYRFAPRPDGAARLVLDLQTPASLLRQGASRDLTFDLAPSAPFVAAPPPPAVEMAGRTGPRRTIVIDAGHGGHDPGAIGATGVREKDVVLDAALQLREALESRGRYRVALTRDADRFVPLEQRVGFARGQNADLFISLHADSHSNSEACGASVYTLSERGANRAQNMMSSQNWAIDLGDAPRNGLVGDILVDLAQRETTNRSAQFAEVVIPRLARSGPLLTNTHRNAGFFVLLAPDVPAVLIETGFLSNVADERRLADPRARQAMAGSMAGAVDAFFAAPPLYMAGA
jgi:N-acetylmuramoyl-L-alanine amidase